MYHKIGVAVNKVFPVALLIFLFVSVLVHFANNASSGVLGKTESLYIFAAKGHYSHTPIDTPSGNWLDAAEKGMIITQDPPGFFALLHFWEYISYREAWLRFLPYLFFIASGIILIRIGILLKLPFFFSVSLGFLPLASSRMVLHAIELRAYGMEVGLTYLMIYVALKIIAMFNADAPLNKGKWCIFSLIIIAGLSSKFSFIITSTAMYCVLWLTLLLKTKSLHFRKRLVSLAISSFIFLLFFVVFFGMRLHLSATDALISPSVDFNRYAMPGTFFDKIIYCVKQICLLPIALFGGSDIKTTQMFYIMIILLIIGASQIVLLSAKNLKMGVCVARMREELLLYHGLFLFPLLALVLSVFLVFLGIYPFSMRSRISLYLQPSFHLFIIGMIKIATCRHGGHTQGESLILNKFCHRKSLAFIVGFITLIYGFLYLSHNETRREGGPQHTRRIIRNMISDSELKDIDYWYISIGEASSFKYHVLYGSLKDKLSSEAKIVIENQPVGLKEKICSELEDIHKSAKKGNKVVMVLGHVNEEEAEVYTKAFFKYFKNAECGEHESSNQQVCYAIR